MENEDFEALVYSTRVVEFVAVAHEFCQLVESSSLYKTADLVNLTRKLLPLLYFKASLLPEVTPVMEAEPEKYVSELDYNLYLQKWMAKLGEYDHYYEVFDPEIQFGSETVTASISENIADIYQDLKDFLTAYRLGDAEIMNDSLSSCISHFNDFWGQRLVNVLRALHQLVTADIVWPDEPAVPVSKKDDLQGSGNWVDRFFDRNEE